MNVTPYVFFNGNCAEALAFYQQTAGAEVCYTMTYGQTPVASHVPAAMHDKIINCAFRIGETTVMASDCPPEKWTGGHQGVALCIGTDSSAAAETIFAAMAQGGTVTMAIGETFFAHRFGQFVDKFGVEWMIIHEKTPG